MRQTGGEELAAADGRAGGVVKSDGGGAIKRVFFT